MINALWHEITPFVRQFANRHNEPGGNRFDEVQRAQMQKCLCYAERCSSMHVMPSMHRYASLHCNEKGQPSAQIRPVLRPHRRDLASPECLNQDRYMIYDLAV